MKLLKVNGFEVDTDDKTVIAVTFQNGDLSEIDKIRNNVSNNISLPLTANNKRVFEFSENPFSNTSIPYSKLTIDYWDNSVHLLKSAKGYLSKVKSRYELIIVDNGDIFDLMKGKLLRELMRESFNPYVISGDFRDLMTDISFYNYRGLINSAVSFSEKIDYPTPQLWEGHFLIKVSEVVSYIEDFTGYKIVNSGTITDLTDFNYLAMPFYDVIPFGFVTGGGTRLTGAYLYDDLPAAYNSKYVTNYNYLADITVLDFIKAILTVFGAKMVIDENAKTIKLISLLSITESTANLDWSGKVMSSEKKFNFGGYAQTNNLDYKLDNDVSVGLFRVVFNSNNSNLQVEKKQDINLFVPRAYKYYYGSTFAGMVYTLGSLTDKTYFTDKPLKSLVFFRAFGATSIGFFMKCAYYDSGMINYDVFTTDFATSIVEIFDFSDYYIPMQNLLTDCVVFDAELNISFLDVYGFSPEKLVKIDELGGVFYVNKITGYNSLAKGGTKVELIKIR